MQKVVRKGTWNISEEGEDRKSHTVFCNSPMLALSPSSSSVHADGDKPITYTEVNTGPAQGQNLNAYPFQGHPRLGTLFTSVLVN